jgi:hypothetical protein
MFHYIIRGSIPLQWEQRNNMHSIDIVGRDDTNREYFKRHMNQILNFYERIYVTNLLKFKDKQENKLTEAFDKELSFI